jgi:hypothetical protein
MINPSNNMYVRQTNQPQHGACGACIAGVNENRLRASSGWRETQAEMPGIVASKLV